MKKNTNWSTPKTNIIAGINDLRKALASGRNAVLVREYNENCLYPIRVQNPDQDFRNYSFDMGYPITRKEIIQSKNYTDFKKHLALNYKNCYGTKEAVQTYYKTGVLTKNNIKGVGISHLVKVTDLIKLLNEIGDTERADMFYRQYLCPSNMDVKHFYDFYSSKIDNELTVKKFKHKLWVVELHNEKQQILKTHNVLIKIINAVLKPLKYVPEKSVLKMKEYTCYTYRIGSIINGFSIEFKLPKKFSFK